MPSTMKWEWIGTTGHWQVLEGPVKLKWQIQGGRAVQTSGCFSLPAALFHAANTEECALAPRIDTGHGRPRQTIFMLAR